MRDGGDVRVFDVQEVRSPQHLRVSGRRVLGGPPGALPCGRPDAGRDDLQPCARCDGRRGGQTGVGGRCESSGGCASGCAQASPGARGPAARRIFSSPALGVLRRRPLGASGQPVADARVLHSARVDALRDGGGRSSFPSVLGHGDGEARSEAFPRDGRPRSEDASAVVSGLGHGAHHPRGWAHGTEGGLPVYEERDRLQAEVVRLRARCESCPQPTGSDGVP